MNSIFIREVHQSVKMHPPVPKYEKENIASHKYKVHFLEKKMKNYNEEMKLSENIEKKTVVKQNDVDNSNQSTSTFVPNVFEKTSNEYATTFHHNSSSTLQTPSINKYKESSVSDYRSADKSHIFDGLDHRLTHRVKKSASSKKTSLRPMYSSSIAFFTATYVVLEGKR